MGVNALWQLLRAEGMVEHYVGTSTADYRQIVDDVDGLAVAVDLAVWCMQADQQTALLPHFSREERCMKVAFERAIQWLRHGCLPVAVVEGRAPEEKRAAQQARFEARNGFAGGGSRQGASQFQRLGQAVGRLLEELGLPVFYAPGEAEATCAALDHAGCVDGVATTDSDSLLYGAETVLHTLKLSATQPRECELKRVRLASIRRQLGLERGGAKALSVLGILSGSDYDLDGAVGVGSAGGLALARHLLQGDADDGAVLARLAAAVQREPNPQLLELTKCTGCASCGHEGGRANRIKRHSSRNPCPCCPPGADGGCREVAFARCACAFHRLEVERRVERILEVVRRKPAFLADAQAAIAVFERQGAEADAYVRQRLAELGARPGQRLRWLHRPRVRGAFEVVDARRRKLAWDLADVRSKLLPLLLEWDLRQAGSADDDGEEEAEGEGVEFRAAEIQKVHGQRSKADPLTGAHWRYVLRWERLEGDAEGLGLLQVRPRKPRASKAGAAAAAAGGGEDEEEGGGAELLSQALLSQAGGEEQAELLTAREHDERWLKEQPAEHRALRISAVRRLAPQLEEAYRLRLAGGGGGGGKTVKASAAGGSGSRARAAAGGGAGGRQRRGAKPAAARQLLVDEAADEAAAAAAAGPAGAVPLQAHQQSQADMRSFMVQRKPGEQQLAAPAGKPAGRGAAAAAAGRGYGLACGSGAAGAAGAQAPRHQAAPYAQHLPADADSMRALLDRALGRPQQPQQQPQQQQQRPPPEQQASPPKRPRAPAAAATAATPPRPAAAGTASTPGTAEFEVLLSSPEEGDDSDRISSPRLTVLPSRERGGRGGREREVSASPPPLAERLLGVARRMEAFEQHRQQQAVQQPAGQQQQQHQGTGRRPMRGAGSASRERRGVASPVSPAAAGAAGLQQQQAAVQQQQAAVQQQQQQRAEDVIDLLTPTRPPLPAAPAAALTLRLAPQQQPQQLANRPQQPSDSPVDLTMDSD